MVTAKKKRLDTISPFFRVGFQSDQENNKKNPIARAKRAPKTEKNPPTRGPHRARKNHFHSNPRGLDRPRGRVVSIFSPRRECDFPLTDGEKKMRFLPTHFVLSVERKNVTYREQRHRLSSARLFARREGRDRRARDRFHGALLLQALGLGDRRFRGQEHGGLDDRSHFIRSGAECAYLYADFRSSCPPFQQHLENRRSFFPLEFFFFWLFSNF